MANYPPPPFSDSEEEAPNDANDEEYEYEEEDEEEEKEEDYGSGEEEEEEEEKDLDSREFRPDGEITEESPDSGMACQVSGYRYHEYETACVNLKMILVERGATAPALGLSQKEVEAELSKCYDGIPFSKLVHFMYYAPGISSSQTGDGRVRFGVDTLTRRFYWMDMEGIW